MTASRSTPPALPAFLQLWREALRTPADDPALPGDRLAEVPVSLVVPVVLSLMGDTRVTARGALSLRRLASGRRVLGVEMEHPLFGGFQRPVRRWTVSLDDVVDVRWVPGRWGGALVVTPMGRGSLAAFPGRPRGPVTLRVGRGGRTRAAALARAVALADLPD